MLIFQRTTSVPSHGEGSVSQDVVVDSLCSVLVMALFMFSPNLLSLSSDALLERRRHRTLLNYNCHVRNPLMFDHPFGLQICMERV